MSCCAPAMSYGPSRVSALATHTPPVVPTRALLRHVLGEGGEHENLLSVDLCGLNDLELTESLSGVG